VKKKILLTGATGFVGSFLLKHLLTSAAFKEAHFFCLYRSERKQKEVKDFLQQSEILIPLTAVSSEEVEKRITWVKDYFSSVRPHFPLQISFDTVIHTAGQVHSHRSQDFYTANTYYTQNLLDSLKNHGQNCHFIYLSSQSASGPDLTTHMRTEREESSPVSHYGKSKLMAECSLQAQKDFFKKITIIRPPMILGPRDMAFLDFFKMIKRKILFIPGTKVEDSLKKAYRYIGIFDLCIFLEKLIQRPPFCRFETYFVAHPNLITLKDLIETAHKTLFSSSFSSHKNTLRFIPIPVGLLKIAAFGLDFSSNMLNLFSIPFSSRFSFDKVKELAENNWTFSSEKQQKDYPVEFKDSLENILFIAISEHQRIKNL